MRLPIHLRLLAFLLVLVYATTSTAVLPALIGWAAALEGSHTVNVAKSASGMQITLHHVRGDFTPKIADHQNVLARVMVSLCKASQSGDHHLDALQLDDEPSACRDRLAGSSSVPRPASAWPEQSLPALLLSLALMNNRVLKARQSHDVRHRARARLATILMLI
jgi:hypothetical protein